MAGFQVSLHGRIWVSLEALEHAQKVDLYVERRVTNLVEE